jgi:protein-tyrosine-phosphatase
MPSILFVCTANRFRSPLAAAFFKRALDTNAVPGVWQVGSAGTWATPGQPVLPYVSEVAPGYELDLDAHRSTRVSRSLLRGYDLALVMQSSHKEALQSEFPDLQEHIYLLSEVVDQRAYDIPDLCSSLQGVQQVAADLDELLQRGQPAISILAGYLHNLRLHFEPHDG